MYFQSTYSIQRHLNESLIVESIFLFRLYVCYFASLPVVLHLLRESSGRAGEPSQEYRTNEGCLSYTEHQFSEVPRLSRYKYICPSCISEIMNFEMDRSNRPQFHFLILKGNKIGRSLGGDCKNRGPVSQQEWHDKDPSLLL